MWISKKKYTEEKEVMRAIIQNLWSSYIMNEHKDALKLHSELDHYCFKDSNKLKEVSDLVYTLNKRSMQTLKEYVDLFEKYGIYDSEKAEFDRKHIDRIFEGLISGE